VVASTDLAVALDAAASRMSRDVLDVLEEGDPGAATSATSSLDCGSNDDVEDFRDLPVVDVATEDRSICGFGRGGNLSVAGLAALLFATLHGLLFGGEAGRSLTGVSALRGCFADGVADLVLRLPSIEVRSMMTAVCESKQRRKDNGMDVEKFLVQENLCFEELQG
jgi:hypothetical protein